MADEKSKNIISTQGSLFSFDDEPMPSASEKDVTAEDAEVKEITEDVISTKADASSGKIVGEVKSADKATVATEQEHASANEQATAKENEEEDTLRDIPDAIWTDSDTKEKPEEIPTKSGRGRKSIKEMALTANLTQVPADEILFLKAYYSISDVAAMFNENVSLIRYWENEFTMLKPKKNGKGDRLFRPEDIKLLQFIYHLLRDKKYTIEGAKDFLKANKKNENKAEVIMALKDIKYFLLEIKAQL